MKKITIILSICVLVSTAWGLQVSNEYLDKNTIINHTTKDKNKRPQSSLLELKKSTRYKAQDSFPVVSSFDEAIRIATAKHNFKINYSDKIDYFKLEAQTDNNSSLDYCISKYFNEKLSLVKGEAISDVNGIARIASSVRVYDTGTTRKATHRIYGEEGDVLKEFTIDAVGFESAESVCLCSSDKLVIDNISGYSNGASIFVHEPNGETREVTLSSDYKGIAVKCFGNSIYIIAIHKLSTIILEINNNKLIPITKINNFEANTDVAISRKNGLILLNDINADRAVLFDTKLQKATKLKVTGACSMYEVGNEILIIGDNKRNSSISFINERNEEVYNNFIQGVFLGFIDSEKEKKWFFFEKRKKSLSTYKFVKEVSNKTTYQLARYKNFDELFFIWDGNLIDLKKAFGLNR